MNNAVMASSTTVVFTLNNSIINTTDVIAITFTQQSVANTGNYLVTAAPNVGGAYITLRNLSGGPLSEAVVLNFTVIKGATS
jgi:isocitrate dehydrogenase